MSRIILTKGRQRGFLNRVHSESGLAWFDIARICGVSERTMRDWRREKFCMRYESARLLSKESSIILPKSKRILSDYWHMEKIAPLGAKQRYRVFGNPGTSEGRRLGGINSQRYFQDNPKYAHKTGFKISKNIKDPAESSRLAEFIGVVLGDGGVQKYQLRVTFNRKTDREYAIYVRGLSKKLFGISSSIIPHKNEKANDIVFYSRKLIDFLLKKDLKVGDKIYNKVDIPGWIKKEKKYAISCLRGLIDTDGSFYSYHHRVNGKVYNNFAICFTSASSSLRDFVCVVLNKDLNFKPSCGVQRIYLHRRKDIVAYMAKVGSNNPKHIDKFVKYTKERYGSGYNRTVPKTV